MFHRGGIVLHKCSLNITDRKYFQANSRQVTGKDLKLFYQLEIYPSSYYTFQGSSWLKIRVFSLQIALLIQYSSFQEGSGKIYHP